MMVVLLFAGAGSQSLEVQPLGACMQDGAAGKRFEKAAKYKMLPHSGQKLDGNTPTREATAESTLVLHHSQMPLSGTRDAE